MASEALTPTITPKRFSLAWPALLAASILLALMLGWVGYAASDDAAYYKGAVRWVTSPPYPGDDHWTTRFPVVLSLALSLLIFGQGLLAFAVTALAWYIALIAVVGLYTAYIGGRRAGWIAAILTATLPVVTSEASTVGCDLAESLFLIAGAWLISLTIDAGAERSRALGAGLCFGAAILCRETAALALLGFAPLFILGRPVPRRTLLLVGAAIATVLLGEMLFQWSVTSDPMRRYALAFNHDSNIDRAANLEGNVLLHPAIDPLLVLFVNNDFALLFWLALAAALSGMHHRLGRLQRKRLLVPLVMATSTFLLVAALSGKLVLNPRYFTLTALAAVIILAIWLASLRQQRGELLLAIAVTANLVMLGVQDSHPRWSSEALVMAAAGHPGEPVFTDRATWRRAEFPLHFAGLRNVRVGRPVPGSLYLAPGDEIPAGAQPVVRYPAPAPPLGRALEVMRLARWLPAGVSRRLLHSRPAALLVRMEDKKSPADCSAGPRCSLEPAF